MSVPKIKIASFYLYLTCLCVILSVSVYDTYWTLKMREIIATTEENPLGVWLMNVDNGDVSLFITCKMAGTILVILFLVFYYLFGTRRMAWLCTSGLMCFQIWLFMYLTFP